MQPWICRAAVSITNSTTNLAPTWHPLGRWGENPRRRQIGSCNSLATCSSLCLGPQPPRGACPRSMSSTTKARTISSSMCLQILCSRPRSSSPRGSAQYTRPCRPAVCCNAVPWYLIVADCGRQPSVVDDEVRVQPAVAAAVRKAAHAWQPGLGSVPSTTPFTTLSLNLHMAVSLMQSSATCATAVLHG